MPCQILVQNSVGEKGAISVIVPIDHIWTHNETFAAWKVKYPTRDVAEYPRGYSLVIVTDREVIDLTYLTTPVIINDDPVGIAWFFTEPSTDSDEWIDLFNTGQTTKTFSEIQPYLVEYS